MTELELFAAREMSRKWTKEFARLRYWEKDNKGSSKRIDGLRERLNKADIVIEFYDALHNVTGKIYKQVEEDIKKANEDENYLTHLGPD